MTVPVLLHGTLASHRRGAILRETLAAEATTTLPACGAVVVAFAEDFQSADKAGQAWFVEWTREPGRTLLFVPPFSSGACERPVPWRAERMESGPRGGEGLAKSLAAEVTHRLEGGLQAPALRGATWADLSVCVGTYRLHPAAGLFAVTCLPLWSLTVLDVSDEAQRWVAELAALAGDATRAIAPAPKQLTADHYGLLVFLLSKAFDSEEQVIAALRTSEIVRVAPDRARSLLSDLHERGLVDGVTPSPEATELVMQSPYAPYVSALREVAT